MPEISPITDMETVDDQELLTNAYDFLKGLEKTLFLLETDSNRSRLKRIQVLLGQPITRKTLRFKIWADEVIEKLLRRQINSSENEKSAAEQLTVFAVLVDNWWKLRINRLFTRSATTLLNRGDSIHTTIKPYSSVMTGDHCSFPIRFKTTPEFQKSISHHSLSNNIMRIIETTVEHLKNTRKGTVNSNNEVVTNPGTVPLPDRNTWITIVHNGLFIKRQLESNSACEINQFHLSPDHAVLSYSGSQNLLFRENNLESMEAPLASEVIVVIKKLTGPNSVLPSFNDSLNSPETLTGLGAFLVLEIFINENDQISGVTFRYNHQYTDGAAAVAEGKKILKAVGSNDRSIREGTTLVNDIDSLLRSETASEPEARLEKEGCIDTTIDAADLFKLSSRILELQNAAKEVLKQNNSKLTDEITTLLTEFVSADLSVAALVHVLLMMSTNSKTGHFLELKRTGKQMGDIGLTCSLNPFAYENNPKLSYFLRSQMLLKQGRSNIKDGNPGNVDVFDIISRGFGGSMKKVLQGLGLITDPIKTRMLSGTMFSSLLIGNKPVPNDSNQIILDGFATALPTDNYSFTCGGCQTEGTKIFLSTRYQKRDETRFKQFPIIVIKNQKNLEKYLYKLVRKMNQLLDRYAATAVEENNSNSN